MIVLGDPQQTSQVVQPEIKAFLRQRFHEICDPELYDPDGHGFFILVESCDTSERIELPASLFFSLFTEIYLN